MGGDSKPKISLVHLVHPHSLQPLGTLDKEETKILSLVCYQLPNRLWISCLPHFFSLTDSIFLNKYCAQVSLFSSTPVHEAWFPILLYVAWPGNQGQQLLV